MTDKEIVWSAILKAEKNAKGFNRYMSVDTFKTIIFRHDFAKAFWGEAVNYQVEFHTNANEDVLWGNLKSYEYHLMNMVLEKEPLKYLKKFL